MLCIFYFVYEHIKSNRKAGDLVLYGNVDIRQVDLGFRIPGRIESVSFEEGDLVKKGDVVAVLDKAPYEAEYEAAKAQLAQSAANFARLKKGNRPQEIEEAKATVKQRKAALENAEATFKRAGEQVKVGAASKQAYDDALAQNVQAEALLENAKEALSLAIEGFRIEDIEAGLAARNVTKAQLESARINLNDTKILSPSNGYMLTRVREPGAIVAPGSVVYTLSLHEPVWIRAYVSETDLGLIKPGMEASVTNDSRPDKPYKGQIGFISPQAEFTPKTVQTPELRTDLVYRLRVIVNDPKGELRQGMPVTVNLKIGG